MNTFSSIILNYHHSEYHPELVQHLTNFDRKVNKMKHNLTYLPLSVTDKEKLAKAYLTIYTFYSNYAVKLIYSPELREELLQNFNKFT